MGQEGSRHKVHGGPVQSTELDVEYGVGDGGGVERRPRVGSRIQGTGGLAKHSTKGEEMEGKKGEMRNERERKRNAATRKSDEYKQHGEDKCLSW